MVNSISPAVRFANCAPTEVKVALMFCASVVYIANGDQYIIDVALTACVQENEDGDPFPK